MPIIIGIILGLACLVSGVGFWNNLPNRDLGAVSNEAIVQIAIDTGQISPFWLIMWGCIFVASATTIMIITTYIFFNNNFVVVMSGVAVGGVVIGGIIGNIIGGDDIISNLVIIGILIIISFGGIKIGSKILSYLERKHNSRYFGEKIQKVTGDCKSILASGFLTIVLLGIIWLLFNRIPPNPITVTPREATLIALEQSNKTSMAELTSNANATASERIYQATESALQITQTAIFMVAQGTTSIPTEKPTNTPELAPTPNISSIMMTAYAQLEVQSTEAIATNTPEPTETSRTIREMLNLNNTSSINVADTLRDPIWGGIGVIVAILFGFAGIYVGWKQLKK